jgi:hypothetical protein
MTEDPDLVFKPLPGVWSVELFDDLAVETDTHGGALGILHGDHGTCGKIKGGKVKGGAFLPFNLPTRFIFSYLSLEIPLSEGFFHLGIEVA